ncbi:MAG: hypothetical protein HKP45_04775 [Winogradskyella sp.]|nr:hypothetical protein [Winogradskyella sp.]MBT8375926.1 hypothetical protein [Bacteroidia bacterium]NNK39949.1 hypothetical protein [Winogradskyella sp.]NNL82161.1 hypothetical protein [Winogradskyella sp.]
MALTIKEKNGTYFVEGALNASTAQNFQTHLEFILNSHDIVTINIDDVKQVDYNGLVALREVYSSALINNRDFYMVGDSYQDIYEDITYTNVA